MNYNKDVFTLAKMNRKSGSKWKKILIINGHPNKNSFCFGIAEAYREGASDAGAEVKEIIIRDLKFNPNLEFGY